MNEEPSNLAIMGRYVPTSDIFDRIDKPNSASAVKSSSKRDEMKKHFTHELVLLNNKVFQKIKTKVEIKKIIKNTSYQNNQFNDNITKQEKFWMTNNPYCDAGRVLVD